MTAANYWTYIEHAPSIDWLAGRIHNWDRYRAQYPQEIDAEMTAAHRAHHQDTGLSAFAQARYWMQQGRCPACTPHP